MLAVAAGASHPAVAALLGLGAVALAGLVVAMAWDVNARQIRLNEQLARRQFIVTEEAVAGSPAANGNGGGISPVPDSVGARSPRRTRPLCSGRRPAKILLR